MSISVNLLVENLSKRVIYVNNIENKTKLRFLSAGHIWEEKVYKFLTFVHGDGISMCPLS